MKKERKKHLDFIIDKLTNSIQNTISGDSFATDVSRLTKSDLKEVVKKDGWNFNWKQEFETAQERFISLPLPTTQRSFKDF